MRLFVGWPLPADAAASITSRIELMRSRLPAASWLRGNAHLTFAFIGEVSEAEGSAVAGAIEGIEAEAVTVTISEAGAFPNDRRPRVIWLGLEPRDAVNVIASRVRTALSDAGTRFDGKRFVPHVTLARTRGVWSSGDMAVVRSVLEDVRGLSLQLDRIVLFRSHLSPKGARHEPLAAALLTRSG